MDTPETDSFTLLYLTFCYNVTKYGPMTSMNQYVTHLFSMKLFIRHFFLSCHICLVEDHIQYNSQYCIRISAGVRWSKIHQIYECSWGKLQTDGCSWRGGTLPVARVRRINLFFIPISRWIRFRFCTFLANSLPEAYLEVLPQIHAIHRWNMGQDTSNERNPQSRG